MKLGYLSCLGEDLLAGPGGDAAGQSEYSLTQMVLAGREMAASDNRTSAAVDSTARC